MQEIFLGNWEGKKKKILYMTKGTLKPKLHIGVNSQNCIIRVFDKGKGNSNERFLRLTEGLRKRSKDWKEILCSGEEIAWAQKTFIWKGTRGSTGRATEQLNRACSLARDMGFYRKFRGRSRAHLFEIGLNKNERFN